METEKNSVLIVDDEAINITALSLILRPDYNVYVEKDGLGCIESAKALKPDLILLDVLMPAMSGFEVIVHLKKDHETYDIPVIFVTGLDTDTDEEKGLVLGAADYMNKPYKAAIVRLRVKNQMTIINQMRLIKNLSVTDALTGLGNRRYFNEQLEQEWQIALRQKKNLGFMILDIDHFKIFNDTYGHLAGDEVLKHVSDIIKQKLLRATDKNARWGGEEFAIILPDTNLNGVLEVAENIRKSFEATTFKLSEDISANITISIGANSVTPQLNDSYSISNFIADADAALYRAKESGRNRVCVAHS